MDFFSASLDTSGSSPPSFPSLSDLLSSGTVEDPTNTSFGGRGQLDRPGSAVSKFKSISPSSLSPLSLPPLSPSSYFTIPAGLSPAELLDSPVLNSSNILPSPTTGTISAGALTRKGNSGYYQQRIKQEDKNFPDFSFHIQPTTSSTIFPSSTSRTSTLQHQAWSSQEPTKRELSSRNFSPEITIIQNNVQRNSGSQSENLNYHHQQSQSVDRSSDDGFNWRKYGQKQVKGSENPRSYYKCTHPNCPVRKQVERSLDGRITEIVYKGKHNHPKPESTRRSSSSSSWSSVAFPQTQTSYPAAIAIPEHSFASHGSRQTDSITTPENSSITIGDDNLDQISQKSKSGLEEFDEDEPDAKRWKSENENEGISAPGSKTVRDQRIVVQTISNIDKLDDGYWWRKYGQKVVKGNPNPRSYYKCTHAGCPVRKHIERASHDLRAVITTYDGKHSHEVPATRGSGRPLPNNYGSSSDNAPTAIRPSAVVSHSDNDANDLLLPGLTRLPTSVDRPPFTVDMLQRPGSLGFSDLGNSMSMGPQINQATLENVFSRTKEETGDILRSFLR